MKRVAILGGSFNPPHLGHKSICDYAYKNLDVDELLVIPCFKHPFGKDFESFDDRIRMCQIAFKDLSFVEISDIEEKLGDVSLTSKTLEELHKQYLNTKFVLLIGEDVKEDLSGWHNLDRIKELADIVSVPRGEKSFIPNISATQIREMISKNQDIAELVGEEVAKYISTNSLYCSRRL